MSKPIRRKTGGHSGLSRYIAHEDGKMYRGMAQDLSPIFKHVRQMDDAINGASKRDNPNQWRYAGSIPLSVLTDWLSKHNATWHQYATNEGGLKDKFKKHINSREFHKLRAKDGLWGA